MQMHKPQQGLLGIMHEPHYEAAWAATQTQTSSHHHHKQLKSLGLTQLGLILDLPIGDPRVDVVQAERDVLRNGHPHSEDLRHPVCHNVQELHWQATLKQTQRVCTVHAKRVCSGAGTPMFRVSGILSVTIFRACIAVRHMRA